MLHGPNHTGRGPRWRKPRLVVMIFGTLTPVTCYVEQLEPDRFAPSIERESDGVKADVEVAMVGGEGVVVPVLEVRENLARSQH